MSNFFTEKTDMSERKSVKKDWLQFFWVLLNIATPFHFIATPSKLRICPWSLKNYKIATALKT